MDDNNYYNYIHAFDPGGITGYVQYNRKTCDVVGFEALQGYYEISQILKRIDKISDMVVFESPVGKITTADQIQMCKYCGFIEGYCESNDIFNVFQPPMVRVGYRKMALDYFKRKHKNKWVIHNVDALAHVLKYISKEERDRFIGYL